MYQVHIRRNVLWRIHRLPDSVHTTGSKPCRGAVGFTGKILKPLRSTMQAVVKTPRIEIIIKGEIPDKLMSVLNEEYGEQVRSSDDVGGDLVDIFETEWYRSVKSGTTPGVNLRIYRENHGLTQARLGQMLGGVPRQHISNMEREVRSISLRTARKLAEIFRVSPEKFI